MIKYQLSRFFNLKMYSLYYINFLEDRMELYIMNIYHFTPSTYCLILSIDQAIFKVSQECEPQISGCIHTSIRTFEKRRKRFCEKKSQIEFLALFFMTTIAAITAIVRRPQLHAGKTKPKPYVMSTKN